MGNSGTTTISGGQGCVTQVNALVVYFNLPQKCISSVEATCAGNIQTPLPPAKYIHILNLTKSFYGLQTFRDTNNNIARIDIFAQNDGGANVTYTVRAPTLDPSTKLVESSYMMNDKSGTVATSIGWTRVVPNAIVDDQEQSKFQGTLTVLTATFKQAKSRHLFQFARSLFG